ncbi:MAG: regulatory protein GemA [Alphaproteobacteria bacterium]|nr:regulatory protein GemA [Alphaproteobacteria bacterium]
MARSGSEAAMASKKQVALVQIARRQLGLSEERYREILRKVALVESSKDLDQVGFELVMQTMAGLGFRSGFTKTFYGRRQGFAHPSQVTRIRALWAEFSGKGDPRGLDRWMERTFRVSSLRFATHEHAEKAERALRSMVRRKHPGPKAAPSLDARKIAAWRYRVIAPALAHPKRSRGRVAALTAIVAAEHAHPDGRCIRFSESAARRWMALFEEGGVEALEPKRSGRHTTASQGDDGGGNAA